MENDIIVRLEKAGIAIDWLSVIWKSDLSGKIKRKQQSYEYYYIDALHGRRLNT